MVGPMHRPAAFPLLLFATVFFLGSVVVMPCTPKAETGSGAPGAPVIQPRAHSHNDYEHARPLLDALAFGFCSVEADIYLVDGALLVAHDRSNVDARRTLDNLYLRPLWERFQANGGHIYPLGRATAPPLGRATAPPEAAAFTLLIDVKNNGAETFRVLDRMLADYAPMLAHFTDDTTTPGAVTVIISGDRATDVILASSPRRAGIDGRLSDLDGPLNRHQMPLISDNWTMHFGWLGQGDMPPDEAAKLDAIVAKAHERGVRVRFWSIPQTEVIWSRLYDAGVDLLNADDLGKLSAVLLKKSGQ
ncbi:MAG: phosphatidylinositol-specific phospholipase C/glycerophosphodiester phosphodiesterase family protein [Spirochaetes bacterium]|nr:phosphatidylinositol-specific phospholipase C/glycerophosphodiester phosphodiesterase family protein [Spirochaetota bacterium]